MVALGRILFALHIIFLLLATIMIVGAIGALTGGGHMIVSGLIVLLTWILFAGMTIKAIYYAAGMAAGRSDRIDNGLWWAKVTFMYLTILSIVTGLGLAFLAFVGCGPLWVPSIYHWGGLVGTVLGFVAYFTLPLLKKACDVSSEHAQAQHWGWFVFPLLVALTWGAAWLTGYLLLKGDINEGDYSAGNRVYKLPFPGGESSWVIQGNNSSLNHKDEPPDKPTKFQKYSWDFRRRCGTPVLAARDGTIQIPPVVKNDGMDGSNNQIQVAHSDGTVAFYLHIQKNSVPAKFLKVGAVVKQGDEIAKVGSVGNSMTGHIHFMVKNGTQTQAVSFTDVKDDKGVPRTFSSYTSGNRSVP